MQDIAERAPILKAGAGQIDVSPTNMLISATHTHSGPVTCDILAMSADPVLAPTDPGYVELQNT